MRIIFKIALRNLFRHKMKSFVIGFIILICSFLMTLGNSVISGMKRGIRENIVERFLGDIVIVSTNVDFNNVIFAAMGKNPTVISEYPKIRNLLSGMDEIKGFTPVGKGIATVLNENGDMGFTYLLGIKFEEYQRLFMSNIILIEGEGLKSDYDKGILISKDSRERFYSRQEFWAIPVNSVLNYSNLSPSALSNTNSLELRSNLVLMSFSDSGSGDLKIDVKGIIKFKSLNTYWGIFSIIDIESFREAFGYFTAKDSVTEVSENIKTLLKEDISEEDIFGEDTFISSEKIIKKDDFKLKNVNVNTNINKPIDIDNGGYNLVLVKLKDHDKLITGLSNINQRLKENNLDGKALPWYLAIEQIANMSDIIKVSLNIFFFILFFVSAIIIMNTLTMSIIERTTEIGMMRAIGTKKGFISLMLITETFSLSTIFGTIGIILAIICVFILNKLNIKTDNEILQLLYGGETFAPYLSYIDILFSFIMLIFVTVFSVLYPISIAKKITPLEAISRD